MDSTSFGLDSLEERSSALDESDIELTPAQVLEELQQVCLLMDYDSNKYICLYTYVNSRPATSWWTLF